MLQTSATRYRQWCFKPRKAWVGTRQILLDTFRFCLFPQSGHEHNGDYHGLTFQCRIKWFLCTRAGMFASSWSTYAFHDFFKHQLSFHVAEVNSMRWNSVHWCCISRCFCLKMLGKGQTWSLHTSLWPPLLGIFEIWLEVSWSLVVICCGKSEYVLKQNWLWLYDVPMVQKSFNIKHYQFIGFGDLESSSSPRMLAIFRGLRVNFEPFRKVV